MSPKILRLEVGQALSPDLQVIAVKAEEMVVKIKFVGCDDANCDDIGGGQM